MHNLLLSVGAHRRLTSLLLAAALGAVLIVPLAGCGRSESYSAGPPPSTEPSGSSATAGQGAPQNAAPSFTRPLLVRQSGQFFSWLAPSDWIATENPNGVDLRSADGSILANAALLRGNSGQADPWTFASTVLTQAGMQDIRQISAHDLPALQSTIPGLTWTIQEFELTFTDRSAGPRHADVICAICGGYGGYDALFQGFSTPPNDFDKAKTWLPLVAGSVNAIDPSKVAYQNDVIPAVNHQLDDSALMSSWEARRQSGDRIDQSQHETTMGYERMVSPIDGRTYDMPFELYDGTMSGYRDPADRNQILKHASPGQ